MSSLEFGGAQMASASRGMRPSSGTGVLGSIEDIAGGAAGALNPLGAAAGLLGDFGSVGDLLGWLKWLVDPTSVLRIIEASIGFVLMLSGLYFLGSAAVDDSEAELSGRELASTATLGTVGKGAKALVTRTPPTSSRRRTVTRSSGPRPVSKSVRQYRREQGSNVTGAADVKRRARAAKAKSRSDDIPF